MLPSCRLLLSLGGALLAAQVMPAAAQSALQMIEQLRPGGATRGIRMPSAEPASPTVSPAPQADSAAASSPTRVPARPAPRTPAVAPTTAPPGTPAVSITVQFATASASLTPSAERALEPLGQALSSPELAPYRFRIEGHTDTMGTAEANRDLSQRRAETVRDFLMQRYNVPVSRLEAVGLGKSQLLVRTGDSQPEQRNRRVQILNIGS